MFKRKATTPSKEPTEATQSPMTNGTKEVKDAPLPWAGPDEIKRDLPDFMGLGKPVEDPYDVRAIKKALGHDPDDPNVTVKFIHGGNLADLDDGFAEGLKAEFDKINAMSTEDLKNTLDDLLFGVTAPVTALPDEGAEDDEGANTLASVLNELIVEITKATDKHPAMNSPHEGYSVILEELDELWDEVKADRGRQASARKEALQVACTAIRYILDLAPNK